LFEELTWSFILRDCDTLLSDHASWYAPFDEREVLKPEINYLLSFAKTWMS